MGIAVGTSTVVYGRCPLLGVSINGGSTVITTLAFAATCEEAVHYVT